MYDIIIQASKLSYDLYVIIKKSCESVDLASQMIIKNFQNKLRGN